MEFDGIFEILGHGFILSPNTLQSSKSIKIEEIFDELYIFSLVNCTPKTPDLADFKGNVNMMM